MPCNLRYSDSLTSFTTYLSDLIVLNYLYQLAQPLRAALTGSNASPGIYEVMWVLGKEECVARLQDALAGTNPVKAAPAKVTSRVKLSIKKQREWLLTSRQLTEGGEACAQGR